MYGGRPGNAPSRILIDEAVHAAREELREKLLFRPTRALARMHTAPWQDEVEPLVHLQPERAIRVDVRLESAVGNMASDPPTMAGSGVVPANARHNEAADAVAFCSTGSPSTLDSYSRLILEIVKH